MILSSKYCSSVIKTLMEDMKQDKFTYKLNLNMVGSVIDEVLTNI